MNTRGCVENRGHDLPRPLDRVFAQEQSLVSGHRVVQ
jgi:hypothetical protein